MIYEEKTVGNKYSLFSVKFSLYLHLELEDFQHLSKPVARSVSSVWMRQKETIEFYSGIGYRAWKPGYNFQSCSTQ